MLAHTCVTQHKSAAATVVFRYFTGVADHEGRDIRSRGKYLREQQEDICRNFAQSFARLPQNKQVSTSFSTGSKRPACE